MSGTTSLSVSQLSNAREQLNQLRKPTLRLGSTHPDVVELQSLLSRYIIHETVTSGVFDNLTDYIVKLFQYRMFLEEDGIVGPKTWRALYTGAPVDMPVLRHGSQGPVVELLQEVLSVAQFATESDGFFGLNTERALLHFQRYMDLTTDGIAGPSTWHALSKTRPENGTHKIEQFTIRSDRKRHSSRIGDVAVASLPSTSSEDFGVATASLDTTVRLWQSHGEELTPVHFGDGGTITSVSFHPTQSQIISGTNGGTVRIADLKNTYETIFPARGGGVETLAVDPAGQYIVTGNGDNAVRLFNFEGELIRELVAATAGSTIEDVAVSRRGTQMAVARGIRGAYVWENPLDPAGRVHRLLGVSYAQRVCFSPDGFKIAVSSGNTIHIFSNQRNELSVEDIPAPIASLAFNVSGRYLALGCRNHKVYVLDLLRSKQSPRLALTLEGHEDVVSAIAFQKGSANAFNYQPEDFFYSADESSRLITWNILTNLPTSR